MSNPRLPERMGSMSEVNKHWLVNGATNWECQGCDWTGGNVQDFWEAHEVGVSEPVF